MKGTICQNKVNPHDALDETLLRQGRLIAEMLKDDPQSVARAALENLERWKRHDSICELHLVWERAIKAGKWMEIRRILTGRGEKSRRFRQTMPFAKTPVKLKKERVGAKRAI